MSSYHSCPDDLFSDESSFYGDETEKSRLEDLADSYDPEPYWSDVHPYLLSTIQQDRIASAKVKAEPTTSDTDMKDEDLIPRRNSRGANEATPSFLSRLPPSTTKKDDIGPWIYAYPQNKPTPENEDIASLVSEGKELLYDFENKKTTLEAEHDKSGAKTKAGLTRKLNPLRRTLEQDLFTLARDTGVTSGKWMLFPTADRVDRYWGLIAEATIKGGLGIAAKVATDDGEGKARLIAVYTYDTADKEDVKRVLMKLVEFGLVNEGERPIYYKSDAFTYLEILGNNSYGLKASMFSSKDVLAGKF